MAEDFQGLPVRRLRSEHLTLDVLATEGPHVVRAFLPGRDENLFAEVPSMTWETPWGTYRIRGGHRLWLSPEAFPRSYVPEQPLSLEEIDGGVRATAAVEPGTGIRKAMEITLDPNAAAATVAHVLANEGLFPVRVAPWALTQLPLGGTAFFPTRAPEEDDYTPNRRLALWPYTRLEDSRLVLKDDWIVLKGTAAVRPIKFGTFVSQGWAGYLRGDVLFRKRVMPQLDARYPDGGCNVESYCYDRFLELETLGPLVMLAPGASTRHVERWEWWVDPEASRLLGGVRALVSSLDSARASA